MKNNGRNRRRERQLSALERREDDLAQYESGNFTNAATGTDSLWIATHDIRNLQSKLNKLGAWS